MKQDEEGRIDLTSLTDRFLKTLKRFWLLVIILTVIGGGLTYAYQRFTYTPSYDSDATITISSADNSTSTAGTTQIKASLPYIVTSSYMKHLVMNDLSIDTFPATVSVNTSDSTSFFVITVSSGDRNISYQILSSIISNLPAASVYTLGRITVNVVDESGMASSASNATSLKKLAAIGAAAGFGVGLVLCALLSFTSQTIQKEEDFKKYLSVKCMACLPVVRFKRRRKKVEQHVHICNPGVGNAYIESFHTIRSRVERSMKKLEAQTVLVTSSIPGEGKSTISASLAMALAAHGSNVILIDCDFRNPSVGSTIGVPESKHRRGVVDVLSGRSTVEEVAEYLEEYKIWVLLGTSRQHNPSSLIASGSLNKLVEELRTRFDYIVLDTPPAAMLADAAALADAADCALYVVKQDYARTNQIVEGLDALTLTNTPVIGAILNSMKKTLGSTYGRYYYGRGYGHYGSYGSDGKKSSHSSHTDDGNATGSPEEGAGTVGEPSDDDFE